MHLKFILVFGVLGSNVAYSLPGLGVNDHEFRKPGPNDCTIHQKLHVPIHVKRILLTTRPNLDRSPCPMLNSLANHGFIPRNGRNVSIDQLVNALDEALNVSPLSTRPVAELGATTSTTGNPTTLHLKDLAKHGGKQKR